MSHAMSDLIVCCVKWGSKYGPVYVNRLRSMVSRNLARRHDFLCLTDDPTGLDPAVGAVALPDRFTGFWNKLSLFRDGLFPHGTTILFFDVDLVIVGPLDVLLEPPGGFHYIRDWHDRPAFNSSVMRFEAGHHPQVYERFAADADAIVASRRYAGDQDWIRAQLPDASGFAPGRIVSYKRDLPSHVFPLAKKLRLQPRWLKAPRWMHVAPPPGASVVVFHGKPDPADVMDASFGPWKRAPFVKEAWR
jgi:hypothetical protein